MIFTYFECCNKEFDAILQDLWSRQRQKMKMSLWLTWLEQYVCQVMCGWCQHTGWRQWCNDLKDVLQWSLTKYKISYIALQQEYYHIIFMDFTLTFYLTQYRLNNVWKNIISTVTSDFQDHLWNYKKLGLEMLIINGNDYTNKQQQNNIWVCKKKAPWPESASELY
jgi:hypothetical protein